MEFLIAIVIDILIEVVKAVCVYLTIKFLEDLMFGREQDNAVCQSGKCLEKIEISHQPCVSGN